MHLYGYLMGLLSNWSIIQALFPRSALGKIFFLLLHRVDLSGSEVSDLFYIQVYDEMIVVIGTLL